MIQTGNKIKIFVGDLEPKIPIRITKNGVPISIVGKTVEYYLYKYSNGARVQAVSGTPDVVGDPANGIMEIALESPDTDSVGKYRLYIRVFHDSRPETFAFVDGEYITLEILNF